MKLTCAISGQPVLSSSAFGRIWKQFQTVHPIFLLSNEQLWKIAESNAATDFQWRKLSSDERKLLFLAILKSTALVDFHCAADPSERFVNQHMPALYYFAAWKNHLLKPTSFPRFSVRTATADLQSLPAWLDECNAVRESMNLALTERDRSIRQQRTDERMMLLQGQAKLSKGAKTRYLNKLCDWMLSEAGVPERELYVGERIKPITLPELVRQVFLITDDKIGEISEDDISYLREYFALNLPAGSLSFFAVQERLQEIAQSKQQQMSSFQILAFSDDDIALLDAALGTVQTPADNANSADDPMPQRANFKTAFAFAYALQQWKQRNAK